MKFTCYAEGTFSIIKSKFKTHVKSRNNRKEKGNK